MAKSGDLITYYACATRGRKVGILLVTRRFVSGKQSPTEFVSQEWTGEMHPSYRAAIRRVAELNGVRA